MRALHRVRINVTARDIKLGKQGDSCLCPVARAIRRRRNLSEAEVGAAWVVLDPPNKVQLPYEAIDFVARFDTYGRRGLEPFHFELEGYW